MTKDDQNKGGGNRSRESAGAGAVDRQLWCSRPNTNTCWSGADKPDSNTRKTSAPIMPSICGPLRTTSTVKRSCKSLRVGFYFGNIFNSELFGPSLPLKAYQVHIWQSMITLLDNSLMMIQMPKEKSVLCYTAIRFLICPLNNNSKVYLRGE